jgi:hypothetical protein
MKKLFSHRLLLLMAVMLVLPLFFFSCDDENTEDPPPPPPNQDGLYVFGTNTIAALATDADARMNLADLDVKQGAEVEEMPGVYGKFMYIGANSTIKFMEVANKVATTFGAANGGTTGLGTDIGNVPINDEVIHGDLLVDGPGIKIAEEGLYYTYLNKNDNMFIIVPVKAQIIGDATELQWSAGTPLPVKSVSKTGAVFEATGVELLAEHGYRYRINDGWHVYQSPNIVTLSSLGVAELWPDAWAKDHNDIGFFLENAPHKETGVFTVTLSYDAETGTWTETKTKTGNILVDYTDTQIGLFGNAYFLPSGAEGSWGEAYQVKAPTKAGSVYTWFWDNTDLIVDREFVILKNGNWDGGMAFLWNTGTAREGAAFTNNQITNTGDNENFHVSVGGNYDITLKIDAAADTRTLTIVKN